MKLHKLSCPNCNGILDIEIEDKKYIYCPYCGQKFFVDDEKEEYTINKNININKNVSLTNRNIDDAKILEIKTYAYIMAGLLILSILGFLFLMSLGIIDSLKAKISENQGLISAGSYEDYEGENYESVVKQLELLGFTNIETVDLNDAGIAIWKSNKVESISIGGNKSFSTNDYFESNVLIIITYH